MANIFTKTNDYVESPNRNVFDGSFANNLTLKMGDLVPVFCKEVLPGDAFKIDATFGLRFMPMVFPVQTRLKANLHFFYVRNRTLWKDWSDFIGKTKEVTAPYLQLNATQKQNILSTGSLGDYLGLPTRSYGEYGSAVSIEIDYGVISGKPLAAFDSNLNLITDQETGAAVFDSPFNLLDLPANTLFVGNDWPASLYPNFKLVDKSQFYVKLSTDLSSLERFGPVIIMKTPSTLYIFRFTSIHDDNIYRLSDSIVYTGTLSNPIESSLDVVDLSIVTDMYVGLLLTPTEEITVSLELPSFTYIQSAALDSVDASELDDSLQPFGSTSDKIHISALPFRAYEAIYNSFYRNPQNNPYILNGQPEYNKYIPTYEGGIDATDYHLHRRNWEADFLTTAVQSPQQGIAPLVGIVNNGVFQFRDSDGNLYNARPDTDDDNNITGFKVSDSNIPVGALQLLVDIANTGISINDFRNVNSFQRWLEKNMRFGLKYKDQIKSHYGVDVRFDELDMPEFIGGTSQPVVINQITNMSPTETSPLGEYGGIGSCVGTSNNAVSHYFDEHGFVIGILSVSPVPVYSQLLPKFFTKSNVFDYFFPEFGHIGMQPIPYKEVAPLQVQRDSETSQDDAFGYQRAWYDYLANTDEVHGEFRTTLRDFLINRTFNTKPELVEDFLLIDNAQINDVFAVSDVSDDKILGQVYFDFKMKRPIPLFGIPRLE